MSGYSKSLPGILKAKAPTNIRLDPRPEYQRVSISLSGQDAFAKVRTTGNQISSRLPSLAAANGLLVLPARTDEKSEIQEGEPINCLVIGPLLTEMDNV